MSIFQEYVKNKYKQLLMVMVCLFSAGAVLFLSGTSIQSIMLVFILILCIFGFFMRWEYVIFKKEYLAVQKVIEEMDQRYLSHELLRKPEEIEAQCYYQLLALANRDMCNKVATNRMKLEESKELIEEWIHELKTPLTSLELLKGNGEKEDISYEVERMKYTLNQCLNYIRMDSLEKDYHVENILLCDLIHELIMEERNTIREKNIAITIEIKDQKEIVTDRKWIGFIFKQLLNNAIKYSRNGGKIIFKSLEKKGLFYVGIQDRGCGIAPEDIPRIWEKGFTGNSMNRDTASGIGLYLVKKCADQMNLRLSVSSSLGEGSCFEVGFPSQPKDE